MRVLGVFFLFILFSGSAHAALCGSTLASITEPTGIYPTTKQLVEDEIRKFKLQVESLGIGTSAMEAPNRDLAAISHYFDAVLDVIDVARDRLQEAVALNIRLQTKLNGTEPQAALSMGWQTQVYLQLDYEYSELKRKVVSQYKVVVQAEAELHK